MASNPIGPNAPAYITENEVKEILTWPLIFEAVEQAMLSVSDHQQPHLPSSSQPARTRTLVENRGGIFSMPGYIGNYKLPSVTGSESISTLACKLVTFFSANEHRANPLPTILGNIFLFDSETGKLQCILEGTEITEQRTAGASIVATQHLFFNRPGQSTHNLSLAIIGCGVQGRIHALGFLSYFSFAKVKLWNRTKSKADKLFAELRNAFPNVSISVLESIEGCLDDADVVVTSTSTKVPLVYSNMLKPNCYINAIGAGNTHFSELSSELYKQCTVYVDNWTSVKTELAGIETDIAGQVGDVIAGVIPRPTSGFIVFQSMGMAVEDATVGQLVYSKYLQSQK